MKKILDVNNDGKIDHHDFKHMFMRYVLGYTNIDSDVFWALAGLCLTVEGIIELYYEQKYWLKVKGEEE